MKPFFFITALLLCATCMAQQPQINLVQIALGFSSPVDIKNCGDDRLFIVEQAGKIRIMDKTGHINATPFLNISGQVNSAANEQGLLSMAFSPNYKQDGYFYINYINGSGNGSTRISRFKVSADSNVADATSEKILLTFSQPFTNHNGSTLMFGPDGYLYDTQGDGGSGGDPYKNGQHLNTYLAKILRLDVSNHDTTYLIPPTNPLLPNDTARPEIWAYGVRNPWRCSFDRLTGDFWIGDVGQDTYEEVDFQPASSTGGENYGWNCREGFHSYNAACGTSSGFTEPVYEYKHSTANGCSITGGYVYRGAQFSALFGRYLFTDFCSGRIYDLRHPSPGVFIPDTLQSFLVNQYSSFGQDNNGELYVAGRSNGRIYRLTDTSTCNPVAFISFADTLQACSQLTLTALYGDTLLYQWYDGNGIINGATNYQYTTTQRGSYSVKVSRTQAGCESVSSPVYAVIHQPDTLIPCNCAQGFCIDHAPFSIGNYFLPTGGTYAGAGVIDDTIFNPTIAGAGTHTITYTQTNTFGCTAHANLALTVNESTPITDSLPTSPVCNTDSAFSLVPFTNPAGGQFTGPAVSNNFFDPSLGVNNDTVYYTYTNGNGCVSVDTFQISVSLCTGLQKEEPGYTVSIIPNPNSGNFNLQLNYFEGSAALTITDLTGKTFLQKQINTSNRGNMAVQLGAVAKGVYVLHIKGSNTSIVRRLIIN